MADETPGFKDLAYRALASTIGGPVDLATMAMRPFGYKVPDTSVIGGSEWIGKKLEDAGLLSSARAPVAEFAASMLVPTPSNMAAAGKGAAVLGGMFIGKGAKTWDALAAAKAKQLEQAGVDARTIWKETGTWRGPDGKLRQEIPDNTSKFTLGRVKPDAYGAQEAKTFEGALKHGQLKRAYPELNEASFLHYPDEAYQGASFNPIDKQVTMGQQAMRDPSRVDLHELQHAIQEREGWAKGGNVSQFVSAGEGLVRGRLEKKNQELSGYVMGLANDAQSGKISYADITSLAQQKSKELGIPDLEERLLQITNPEEAYRRLAGEAEARATQARAGMNAEQRRAAFPADSYDVPLDRLIIK